MIDSAPLSSSEFPLIWFVRLLPDAERNDAFQLLSAADGLKSFVRNFEMALRLFEMAFAELQRANEELRRVITAPLRHEQQENRRSILETLRTDIQKYSAWARIAARDGALQIYHLGAVISAVKGALHNAPTLLSLVDKSETRTASKLLESYFPNYELIRDAVAHSIFEVAPDSERRQKHAVDHPVDIPGLIYSDAKGLIIGDSLNGDNYVVTFEKRIATYEINNASLAKLQSVLKHFLDAFEPAREAYSRRNYSAPANATDLLPL